MSQYNYGKATVVTKPKSVYMDPKDKDFSSQLLNFTMSKLKYKISRSTFDENDKKAEMAL